MTADMLPMETPAVCLITPHNSAQTPTTFTTSDEEEMNRNNAIGIWAPCMLHEMKVCNVGKDDEMMMYDVELLGDMNYGDRLLVPRLQVCFAGPYDTLVGYGDRVIEALTKRRACVALMKYDYFVRSMPYQEEVSSTLEQEQGTRILDRAYNDKRLLEVKEEVRDVEMNEAREGYEAVMNKIIFDANQMSSANVESFAALKLPQEAFPTPKAAPESGLWPGVPAFPMQTRTRNFMAEAYFASLPAISALQGAVALARDLDDVTIVNMYYDKTFSLDKYERYLAEQMLVAQRSIKQQWPTKTGGVIRHVSSWRQPKPCRLRRRPKIGLCRWASRRPRSAAPLALLMTCSSLILLSTWMVWVVTILPRYCWPKSTS